MKEYTFTSTNNGDISFTITGDYRNGNHDVSVEIANTGAYKEFEDVGGNCADDMFDWLVNQGVKFESKHSLWFNFHYVESVLLDGDMTEDRLLRNINYLTDDHLNNWVKFFGFEKAIEEGPTMKNNVVINSYGIELDYDIAVTMMDDDIREKLHSELAPCTNQKFFDAYAAAHTEKFGEKWTLDTNNPQY